MKRIALISRVERPDYWTPELHRACDAKEKALQALADAETMAEHEDAMVKVDAASKAFGVRMRELDMQRRPEAYANLPPALRRRKRELWVAYAEDQPRTGHPAPAGSAGTMTLVMRCARRPTEEQVNDAFYRQGMTPVGRLRIERAIPVKLDERPPNPIFLG